MDATDAARLRQLLSHGPVAALATLHRGEPAVSMVPFVLPAGDTALLIHVSALATHTRDMLEHPRVALLVTAEPAGAGVPPQALPRVALQCDAAPLARESAAYAGAKAHYLARFADAAPMFELGDFSVFALQPVAARLVAGFGRAHGLVGDPLARWLRGDA
jgi:heme iron utilization protein